MSSFNCLGIKQMEEINRVDLLHAPDQFNSIAARLFHLVLTIL